MEKTKYDIIRDIAIGLGLNQQPGESWTKTLGDYLNIDDEPGYEDNYPDRVLVAAISNTEAGGTINTKDDGNAFNSQTVGYNFVGDGVTLTNSIDNIVNVNIPGPKKILKGNIYQTGGGNISWSSRLPAPSNTQGPMINTFQATAPTFTRNGVGEFSINFTGTPFAGFNEDRVFITFQAQDEWKMRKIFWSMDFTGSKINLQIAKPDGTFGLDQSGEGNNLVFEPSDSMGQFGIQIELY